MLKSNLPISSTSFIGREAELANINDLLTVPTCCLLTLTGSGGIGKTRLAIQIASLQAPNFTHGVFFVPLQSISKPEHIVSAIADTVKFQFYEGDDPKQQLLDYLHEKHMLLILDNFEHLLSGIDLVIDILAYAPQIKLLVTSREVLNVRQEWLYHVKGMNYPDINATNIEDYDAIQLFIERARRLRRDFSVDRERSNLIRITRLVEGMPLAIELSATWLKSLSCKAIGDEIQYNLDFLSTNLRDIPQRHQSMLAVFEHSWNALSIEERSAFMKLTVCQGGCTREAALAITGASLTTLASLVDKSFIRRGSSDRYEIHELLRQYGEKQLEEFGNTQAVYDAHTEYFLEYLEKRESAIKGHGQFEALNDIEVDLENVRKAWDWAVEQQNDRMINVALESLFWFCVSRHRLKDGVSLFQQVLEKQSPTSLIFTEQTLGRVFSRKIYLQILDQIENEDISEPLERSLEIADRSNNLAEIAFCIATKGEMAYSVNDYASANLYFEQALVLYRQFENHFYMIRTLQRIGHGNVSLGRFEESRIALQEAIDIAYDVGDRIGMALCLNSLATVAGFSGDYISYEVTERKALALQREIGDQAGASSALADLAIATFFNGDIAATENLAQESFDIAQEINHQNSKNLALIMLGLIATVKEDYEKSQSLLETAHSQTNNWFRIMGSELGLAMIACGQGNWDLARAKMQSLFDTPSTWQANRLWPRLLHLLPVVYALTLIDGGNKIRGIEILSSAYHYRSGVGNILNNWPLFSRLQTGWQADLGDDVYLAAWEHGKAINLEDVMVNMLDELSYLGDASQDLISERLKVANQKLHEPLTPREHEILCHMSQGLTNREIADQLVIGVSTVKKHINHIYSKLGTSDRIKAVNQARRLNLLPPSPP